MRDVNPVLIGDRVRTLRLNSGMSQRELAAEVSKDGTHCSYAYLSRIESGHRAPSESVLRGIARVFGTTAHELESGKRGGRCPHCGRR
jgi:transcriptional regulator with XRE-family HTH domain